MLGPKKTWGFRSKTDANLLHYAHSRFALIFLFVSIAAGHNDPFYFKSDEALLKARLIQRVLDVRLEEAKKGVKIGNETVTQALCRFWSKHSAQYIFLVDQSEAIVSSLIQRLEVEMDLIFTDSEMLEEAMELDLSQFLEIIEHQR